MRSLSFITLSLAFTASSARREWKPIYPGTLGGTNRLLPEDPRGDPYDSLLEKEKLFDIQHTSKKIKETIKMEDNKRKKGSFGVEQPPITLSPTFTDAGGV
jgi:hypothetical protein